MVDLLSVKETDPFDLSNVKAERTFHPALLVHAL